MGESSDGHMPVSKGLPSTLDGGQEVAVTTFVIGLFGTIAIFAVFDGTGAAVVLTSFLWIFLFLTGAFALRWIRRRKERERALEAEAYTAMMDAVAASEIAEVKERGDFDRFEAKSERHIEDMLAREQRQ